MSLDALRGVSLAERQVVSRFAKTLGKGDVQCFLMTTTNVLVPLACGDPNFDIVAGLWAPEAKDSAEPTHMRQPAEGMPPALDLDYRVSTWTATAEKRKGAQDTDEHKPPLTQSLFLVYNYGNSDLPINFGATRILMDNERLPPGSMVYAPRGPVVFCLGSYETAKGVENLEPRSLELPLMRWAFKRLCLDDTPYQRLVEKRLVMHWRDALASSEGGHIDRVPDDFAVGVLGLKAGQFSRTASLSERAAAAYTNAAYIMRWPAKLTKPKLKGMLPLC